MLHLTAFSCCGSLLPFLALRCYDSAYWVPPLRCSAEAQRRLLFSSGAPAMPPRIRFLCLSVFFGGWVQRAPLKGPLSSYSSFAIAVSKTLQKTVSALRKGIQPYGLFRKKRMRGNIEKRRKFPRAPPSSPPLLTLRNEEEERRCRRLFQFSKSNQKISRPSLPKAPKHNYKEEGPPKIRPLPSNAPYFFLHIPPSLLCVLTRACVRARACCMLKAHKN